MGLRANPRKRGPGMVDSRRRKRKAPIELLALHPGPLRALTPPLKLAVPSGADTFPEVLQRARVRGHSVILVVPSEHAREPRVLSAHRLVPAFAHLVA